MGNAAHPPWIEERQEEEQRSGTSTIQPVITLDQPPWEKVALAGTPSTLR